MLILISPAKSLDLRSPAPDHQTTEPRMLDDTARLATIMAGKTSADLRTLMDVSEEIATLNVERYRNFQPGTPDEARPAAVTFNGAVYRGMEPHLFTTRDWTEAQKVLRILSGLYGVLRPLDRIQPYRLEMGTALHTDRGSTLVDWWGERIRTLIEADLAESPGAKVIVNLASAEYFRPVKGIDAAVISPRFESRDRQGRWKVISFTAKTARGLMAGWLVRNRVRIPGALKSFDVGWRYHAAGSTPEVPVFRKGNDSRNARSTSPAEVHDMALTGTRSPN